MADEEGEELEIEPEEEELEADEDVASETSEASAEEDLYLEMYKTMNKKDAENKKTVVQNGLRTQDKLTLFEYAAIIEARSSMISQSGGASYSKNAKEYDTPRSLAIKEFSENMRPLSVYRQIKKGLYETA